MLPNYIVPIKEFNNVEKKMSPRGTLDQSLREIAPQTLITFAVVEMKRNKLKLSKHFNVISVSTLRVDLTSIRFENS